MSIKPTRSQNSQIYVGNLTTQSGQLGRTVFSSGSFFDQSSTPSNISNRYILNPTENPSTFNLARITNPVTPTSVIPGYKVWLANRSTSNSLEIYETSTDSLFIRLSPEFTAVLTAETPGTTGTTPDLWKTLMMAPTINIPPTLPLFYRVNDTVFVDVQYGDNGTGERENPFRPFADIQAAITAANSGDTINARPGTYSVTSTYNLAGKELNLYFEMGAILEVATGIHAFGGDTASYQVSGFPTFNVDADGGVLDLTGASFGPSYMEILEIESPVSARLFNIPVVLATIPAIKVQNNILMEGTGLGSYLLRTQGNGVIFEAVGLAKGGEHSVILLENLSAGNLVPTPIKFNLLKNLNSTANGSVVFTETTDTRGNSFALTLGKVEGNSSATNHLNLSNPLEYSILEVQYLQDAEINLDGPLASFTNLEVGKSNSVIRDSHTNTLVLNLYAAVLDTLELNGLGNLTGHLSLDRLTNLFDSTNTSSTLNWSLHSLTNLTSVTNGATYVGTMALFENSTLINFNFKELKFGGCKGTLIFQNEDDIVFDLGSLEGDLIFDGCTNVTCQVGNVTGRLIIQNCVNLNLEVENVPQLEVIASTDLNLVVNRLNYDQAFNEGLLTSGTLTGKIWIHHCRGRAELTSSSSNLNLFIQHLKNIDANPLSSGLVVSGSNLHLVAQIDFIENFRRAIDVTGSHQSINLSLETIQNCATGLVYDQGAATINELILSVRSIRTDTSDQPNVTGLASCAHLDVATVDHCLIQLDRVRTEETLGTRAFDFTTVNFSQVILRVKNFESPVVSEYVMVGTGATKLDSSCLDCQLTNPFSAQTTVYQIDGTQAHLIQGRYLNDNNQTNYGITTTATTQDLITLDCTFIVTTAAILSSGTTNLQTEDFFVSNQGVSGTVNFSIAAFNKLSQAGISY